MGSSRIVFRENNEGFSEPEKLAERDWIETSFQNSSDAVGRLRFPSVDNGRYQSKEPIKDSKGNLAGYLSDGQRSLGYTFYCVFVENCFWVTHQGFSSTMNGGGSALSIVDKSGSYFWTKEDKYGVTKSFGFDSGWVDGTKAYKSLNGGKQFLYLTSYGVCLFDASARSIISKIEFGNLAHQNSGFALSPKTSIIAVAFSEQGPKDVVDGEYRYSNCVIIYSLEDGSTLGSQDIPGNTHANWNVGFSTDGRTLSVSSEASKHAYELVDGQ